MTPHNAAQKNDIAKTVLLPGDPLRAKYIAENFLQNSKQITSVRNILGFTGTYNGKEVTVMGSGMGGPSAGIYSFELYKFYDVQNIIRIGTAGGLQKELEPGDIVFAMTSSTDSNYAYQYDLCGSFSPAASFDLLEKAVNAAKSMNIRYSVGGVFSSDFFSEYNALGNERTIAPYAKLGILAQDMETYALYCNAAYLHKEALSIVTMTDSCVTGKSVPDNERMTCLHNMFKVALECL